MWTNQIVRAEAKKVYERTLPKHVRPFLSEDHDGTDLPFEFKGECD